MKNIKQLLIVLMLTIATFTGFTLNNNILCYEYSHQWHGDPETTSTRYLYAYEYSLDNGEMTEQYVFEEIAYYNSLTDSDVQQLINDGYLHSYIDDLIAVGRLPQGFVPNQSTTQTPSNDNTETNSGDNGNTTTNNQTQTNNSNPGTSNSTPEVEITCDDTVTGTYVVITVETPGYSTYSTSSNKARTWALGEEAEVTGLMSNEMYRVEYEGITQYIRRENLVRKDLYDAAWEETNRTDATCTSEGSVTYTNTYTNTSKTETLAKLEHDYETTEKVAQTCTEDGYEVKVCSMCQAEIKETLTKLGHSEGELKTVRKANLIFSGKMESRCLTCDKIITTKTIPAKVPIIAVVGILVLIAGGGVGVYMYKKHEDIDKI